MSCLAETEEKDFMRTIKAALAVLFLASVFVPSSFAFEESGQLNGTWSGEWKPKTGNIDDVTIELQQEGSNGALNGKFLSPAPMPFTHAAFDAKTHIVHLEAMQPKTGKLYKIEARLNRTELNGKLTVDNVSGDLLLIKWTFFPH
jgi:hypothetical protein